MKKFAIVFLFMIGACSSLTPTEELQYENLIAQGAEPITVKSPTTAAMLNILPGGGDIYNGEWGALHPSVRGWLRGTTATRRCPLRWKSNDALDLVPASSSISHAVDRRKWLRRSPAQDDRRQCVPLAPYSLPVVVRVGARKSRCGADRSVLCARLGGLGDPVGPMPSNGLRSSAPSAGRRLPTAAKSLRGHRRD